MSGDITTLSIKIDALNAALAAETISPETKVLLDEVTAASDALKANAEAIAAIVA